MRKRLDYLLASGVEIDTILKQVNTGTDYVDRKALVAHNERHRLWSDNQAYEMPVLYSGDVVEQTNFQQLLPGTEIGVGVAGITLRKCNLINCKFPKGTSFQKCQRKQVSYCSHLHPELVSRGLKECRKNCKHVVSSLPEVVIEGRVVARDVYQYRDK